ncbi:hypothetical protein B0H66DRAFT_510555 [Apodospora peruviana]|uniref:Nucleoporin NUP53 n=1 Tax=Apodospora peruviana TaxID=516989 RepID=A0AAE0MHC5_9PEZI|nr:hypothetical protein B0H66DRAFT_510555 [Apodospora peruviana]
MAPLILHNVPDEELYVGDDGIQRPYAMVFPQQDGSFGRARKTAPETGSFGKSTRRSRSKTGTPARREDPTIAAADRVFSNWIATQTQEETTAADAVSRKKSIINTPEDEIVPSSQIRTQQQPTEVMLRGYRSAQQQYAAINHYEQLAGRICEDYPRDPPVESRRYKSELRDPAFSRRRALTTEERAKVNKADGGEHWVKVTFESAEAADSAIFSSPQTVLGHIVVAEPYHGIPPSRDEALPAEPLPVHRSSSHRRHNKAPSGSFVRAAYATTIDNNGFEFSPPHSLTSSRTADTTTVASTADTGTLSSETVTGTVVRNNFGGAAAVATATTTAATKDSDFCRVIPTARKARLLPVEQALLPAPSVAQRLLNHVPFLKWFSGAMIGSEIPRTDTGEFDWDKASLYWKIICWLDLWFRLFGGEILNADKDE